MEKAIATALMTIAAVIAVLAVVNAALPAVNRANGALADSNRTATDQMRTSVTMVYVTGETASSEVVAWVKNTGSTNIAPLSNSDIILTTPTTVKRLGYGSSSGSEYWDYTLDGSTTTWTPGSTIQVTLHLATLPAGSYSLTFSTPNGISANGIFSV